MNTPFPSQSPSGIALFDMDGTLLAWDCQLLFRSHIISQEPLRWFFVPVFLLFLPLTGLLGTENMKRIFHCFLFGMPEEDLKKHSKEFAQRLAPSIYSELKERLSAHQQKGHFTILSSASPECYVAEVGKLLGFDLALGTVLRSHDFFPDLTNHKGEEKVHRLHRTLPESYFQNNVLIHSHGYTDSPADLPMLGICQRATLINPGEHLTEISTKTDWEILRPQRPWKSQLEKHIRTGLMLFGLGKNPAKL